MYIWGGKLLGDDVNKHLKYLLRTQWLSPEELREFQWNKLINLLKHAYDKSLFYRKQFEIYGVKPEDIKDPNDMRKLPILTKNDLRDNYNELVVTEGNYKYSIAKSSGSTGQFVKFYKDRNSSGNGRAAMYRGHSWYGLNIGDREARLWGIPLNCKEKIIARIGDYLLNRFREKNFQLTEEVMYSFYSKMKRFRPDYLMGFSSLVYEFAQFLRSEQIDASIFALKMVKVTSDNIFDYQRKIIKEVFQCPVVMEYGAAEVGLIAFECPNNGLHITSEGIFIEEDKAQIPESNEFIITDLNNLYSPIIRYKIGDYGNLSAKTCRCGRGLPLLDRIIGRTNDVVYKTDGTSVHSSVFSFILKDIGGSDGGIKQFKIYQKAKGYLKIDIVKDKNFNMHTLNHLRNSIFKELGRDIKLDIQYINNIEREKSGKLRYFVSEIRD